MGYALTDFGKIELLQVEWIDAVPANQLGHVIVVLGKYIARNGVVGLEDEAAALGRVQLGENRCSVFFFDPAGQRLDIHVAAKPLRWPKRRRRSTASSLAFASSGLLASTRSR